MIIARNRIYKNLSPVKFTFLELRFFGLAGQCGPQKFGSTNITNSFGIHLYKIVYLAVYTPFIERTSKQNPKFGGQSKDTIVILE